MQIWQKDILSRDFEVSNEHERDALASAMYAYKLHRKMFERVFKEIKENPDEAIKRIVSRQARDISSVIKPLTERSHMAKRRKEIDVNGLKERIQTLEIENSFLKERIAALTNEKKSSEARASNKTLQKRDEGLLSLNRLETIRHNEREIGELKSNIALIEKKLRESLLRERLAKSGKYIIAKNFRVLSEAIEDDIYQDIVLVKDLKTPGDSQIRKLKECGVSIIGYDNADRHGIDVLESAGFHVAPVKELGLANIDGVEVLETKKAKEAFKKILLKIAKGE